MVTRWLTSRSNLVGNASSGGGIGPGRMARERRAWCPTRRRVATMDARAAAIADGRAPELVWLLEHPPLYTAGTSAKARGSDRGALSGASRPAAAAQFTYHGPGQRVAYVMLDLKRRGPDVRRFVATLEEWIIRTLASFNVRGERRDERIGVWVRAARQGRRPRGQDRRDRHPRAALGDAARHRASTSSRTCRISPASCRAASSDARYGVTSLADLGVPVDAWRRSTRRCGGSSRRCSDRPSAATA